MELYLIKDLLEKSIKKKQIYCFKEYGDDNFYCGYVLAYNADTIQIQHYTRYGEDDGTLSINFSNIKNISIKGEYNDRIEYLIEKNTLLNTQPEIFYSLIETSEGFLPTLKYYENDRTNILNLEINNDNYIGFIDTANEHYIIFTEIDNDGSIIETSIYKTEDITSVKVNDKLSRRNLMLHNWRKQTQKKQSNKTNI